MPRKSRFELPPLELGSETLGQRISRLRKEHGLTQVELAAKIGIIQANVSAYENDKVRPHAEMIIRLSQAIGTSTDELLGISCTQRKSPNLRLLKRLEAIENLPSIQKKTLIRTIDTFLKANE